MKQELSDTYINSETGRLRVRIVDNLFTGPVTGVHATIGINGKINEGNLYFATTSGAIKKK